MKLAMYDEDAAAPSLPYPALSFRCLLIVEKAVCTTWEQMVSSPRLSFDLRSADEDEVTHELYERLFDEVFDHGSVEGFDREVFAWIDREAKVRNFDASKQDLMPDMLIRFVDRPTGAMNTQHGLFIECKPVDSTHTTGVCYCDKGLIRFIRGDYAWTMRNAMMIGYARPGYELVPELADAFAKQRKEPIPTEAGPTPCARSLVSSLVQQVVTTVHERTFLYMDSQSSPGQISVRHLWLKRPSV